MLPTSKIFIACNIFIIWQVFVLIFSLLNILHWTLIQFHRNYFIAATPYCLLSGCKENFTSTIKLQEIDFKSRSCSRKVSMQGSIFKAKCNIYIEVHFSNSHSYLLWKLYYQKIMREYHFATEIDGALKSTEDTQIHTSKIFHIT